MIYLLILLIEVLLLYFLRHKILGKLYRFLGPYPFAILFLPGTFIHEMSHFLVALFLLVPVGQIELMPKLEEKGIKMGSVPIGKTDPFRRTLIGVAPVIFGFSIIIGSVYYVFTNDLFTTPIALVALALISFEVGNTMFSSKKDLEGSIIVVVLFALIYSLSYFLGVRITFDIPFEILEKGALFLLFPLAVDSILLLIFNLRR